jgi:hypothetical protein
MPRGVLMRITDGTLVPVNQNAKDTLNSAGLKTGQVVSVHVHAQRNPGFYRMAHRLGQLVADHVDGFEGLDSHGTLKRLQAESGAGCDNTSIQVAGQWMQLRTPRSLSFSSVNEAEFRAIYTALSDHVAATYWEALDGDAVRKMAEAMPDA